MSGRRSRLRLVVLSGIATLAGGCLPAPATAEAREVAGLYTTFVAIAAVVGVLVFGLATWAIVRYRARGDASLPAQTSGNLKLEAAWTGLPILTVIVLFALTLVVLNRVEARAPEPGVQLRVEAFRWGWTFRYPDEGIAVSGAGAPGPEVVVPVGEPIRITLAGTDVNHAFFVPRFLFKRDVIPGRDNVFELTIEEPGAYGGQCAEFCGIYHAQMPFTLRAVERDEYEAWLASQPRDGEATSAPLGSPFATPAGSAGASPSEPIQPLESLP